MWYQMLWVQIRDWYLLFFLISLDGSTCIFIRQMKHEEVKGFADKVEWFYKKVEKCVR